LESQRPRGKPREIVIEERHEVIKHRYSWWALSVLALILCAILVFLIVKQVMDSNPTVTGGEPIQQNGNQTPANQQAPSGSMES